MFPPPVVLGGEGQHSGDESQESIRPGGLEEGIVSAIVEDDKDPDEETSGENTEWNGEPPGDREAEIEEKPNQQIPPDGVENLPTGPPAVGDLILGDDGLPLADGLASVRLVCRWFFHV